VLIPALGGKGGSLVAALVPALLEGVVVLAVLLSGARR